MLCGDCGQPRDVTFAPESFGRFKAEPLVCHACAARDRAARVFAGEKADSAGVKYSVIDREEVHHG